MAIDKIYLNIIDLDSGYVVVPSFKNNGGTEYIRKDTLMEWAKEQWLNTRNGTMADQIRSSAYEEMIKHINSL